MTQGKKNLRAKGRPRHFAISYHRVQGSPAAQGRPRKPTVGSAFNKVISPSHSSSPLANAAQQCDKIQSNPIGGRFHFEQSIQCRRQSYHRDRRRNRDWRVDRQEFAQRGAPVLIASRKIENLERVRDEIRKAGGKCDEWRRLTSATPTSATRWSPRRSSISDASTCSINNHGASITTAVAQSLAQWMARGGRHQSRRRVLLLEVGGAPVYRAEKPRLDRKHLLDRGRTRFAHNAPVWRRQGRRYQPDGVPRRRMGSRGNPRQL